jgi:hypothetical protein
MCRNTRESRLSWFAFEVEPDTTLAQRVKKRRRNDYARGASQQISGHRFAVILFAINGSGDTVPDQSRRSRF